MKNLFFVFCLSLSLNLKSMNHAKSQRIADHGAAATAVRHTVCSTESRNRQSQPPTLTRNIKKISAKKFKDTIKKTDGWLLLE